MGPIAARILKYRDADGETKNPIRIFAPEWDESAWICRYEIDWPGRKWKKWGGGVDAVQALISALQLIGTQIYASEEHRLGRLSFGEGWLGYGFPVTNTMRDLLVGDDAKYF